MTDSPDDVTHVDDELGPPRTYGPDIWNGTGFGPALGGLIVAFLGTWGGTSFALAGYGGVGSTGYRTLAGIIPLLMGLTGIVLGWLTLRRRTDGLARAIGAAAIIVGVLTLVTGAMGWWGQEIARNCANGC